MRYSIVKSQKTNLYYIIDDIEKIVISEHPSENDAQKSLDKLIKNRGDNNGI